MTPPSLVLASASPRRRALLEQLGIPLRVDPAPPRRAACCPERRPGLTSCGSRGRRPGRSTPVTPVPPSSPRTPAWCWTAWCWASPRRPTRRWTMLRALSGRTHDVLTAVAVAGAGERAGHRRRHLRPADRGRAALVRLHRRAHGQGRAPTPCRASAASWSSASTGSHSAVVGLPLVETLALLRRGRVHPALGTAMTDVAASWRAVLERVRSADGAGRASRELGRAGRGEQAPAARGDPRRLRRGRARLRRELRPGAAGQGGGALGPPGSAVARHRAAADQQGPVRGPIGARLPRARPGGGGRGAVAAAHRDAALGLRRGERRRRGVQERGRPGGARDAARRGAPSPGPGRWWG